MNRTHHPRPTPVRWKVTGYAHTFTGAPCPFPPITVAATSEASARLKAARHWNIPVEQVMEAERATP